MKINYYLSFKEERRLSMDEYGDELLKFQKENFENLSIKNFRPEIGFLNSLIPTLNFKMRYARYVSYPNQIKSYHIMILHTYVINSTVIFTNI